MATGSDEFVLPRPTKDDGSQASKGLDSDSWTTLSAPSEAAFTDTFGALLPPADYLHVKGSKAAYYKLFPASDSGTSPNHLVVPDRVILLHGVQTPALGLLPLARTLQASFPSTEIVLLDWWGHGLSDTPVMPHDVKVFLQLLDLLLDKLGWPKAHLIGYSFGGNITVEYTNWRSERVQSFVLVAPAGLLRMANFTPEQQAHFRGGGDEVAARQAVIELLEDGELVVPTDWKERVDRGEIEAQAVKAWQMRNHPGHTATLVAIVRDGRVMDNGASFQKAAHAGVPSLSVLGGTDPVCSEQDLQEVGFDNIKVVPQAGHKVVRDPATVPGVARFITDFWRTL